MLKEWYSDIPWHQKLGTFAGNEIDAAIVLPYDALGQNEKDFCTSRKLTQEDCMLEAGIDNILGIHRIELQPRAFGTEPQTPPYGARYGGYVITDGSTYAPQMPWYMAHYCDSGFKGGANDVQDPVCYGDYFSPMNNGFNPMGLGATDWPRSIPWSVFPFSTADRAPANHCKPGETKCTLAMAGFDLREVPPNPDKLQYKQYNQNLLAWFNEALQSFPTDVSQAEHQRHFPWTGSAIAWETFLYPQGVLNPFLGQFDDQQTAPAEPADCDVTVNGPTNPKCTQTATRRASSYAYPRQCTLGDLAGTNMARLRQCGLNYELHHNGFLEQWPESYWPDLDRAGMLANQYGRTSFLFSGVPGMQMPVSLYKDSGSESGLNIYEQVHNASIFSLYLPIANVADIQHAYQNRNYKDKEFFHTLLMSNHMESDPLPFAEGIRGKVLWHNEYRTQKMYEASASGKFGARTFAAAFDPRTAPSPFHNNTCDGCHVRNGSGVPINTEGNLDAALQEFMKGDVYNPDPVKDYTFTGQIRPMKLVFFDLHRDTTHLDASRYSEPLAFAANLVAHPPRILNAGDLYYNNKIMNFYGDSFHANTPGYNFAWNYETANANRMVVGAARVNSELNKIYAPLQVKLGAFQTSASCQLVLPAPTSKPWPSNCDEINDAAIRGSIDGSAVGFMLLNGKRLGNLSAMEAIPSQAILGFRDSQRAALGEAIAGEIIWNAGSRDGVDGKVHKVCRSNSLKDCYIGRFGWLGDRASIEDQVANAAFVEMNMTTSEGYEKLYANEKVMFPIRYAYPNCGPANKTCVESKGNADLSERDIQRMADDARWLGDPTRSEFQVALPEVVAGEKIFRKMNCDTCHVIRKIDIVPDDTMVTRDFRDRLATRVAHGARPFLSYIGTDLLMHDMGYLSQVGNASQPIRDNDGVVMAAFRNYVQKIRTPALKGHRFNRFVTDSHKNTKNPGDPACDFLLHDGRACDAIEAAFLHDGPAIRKLRVIDGLNALTPIEILELRAFLYSL